jgi:two-component system NtrC family sensor kinase
MTLSRRMTINLAALVVAIAGIGAVGVVSLLDLQRDLADALAEHERSRQTYERFLYDIGTPILQARRGLNNRSVNTANTLAALRQAAIQLDAMDLPAADPTLRSIVDQAGEALRRAIDQLQRPSPDPNELNGNLNIAFGVAVELSRRMQNTLDEIELRARQRTTTAVVITGGAGLAIVLVAMAVGIMQHRGVVRPIARIEAGVERFASGDFQQRLPATGDEELAALARQFNTMADELESLYRDLEQRVRKQSRQLVQAERLASVGFLAAGVAHEINNPLAIIAGHAELALRKLSDEDPMRPKLQVICDEAFRCKAITEKLLSLSRGEPDEGKIIDLRQTVGEVVEMVTALPRWAHRQIAVDMPAEPLAAKADPSRMKQVLLNLLTNAAAATTDHGRISVAGRNPRDAVVIEVTDDGKGMDEATLGRVFEPFYTDRRGTHEPGTGLGLSISHAIVTDHGGALTAASDGAGRGSTFTIRLPRSE